MSDDRLAASTLVVPDTGPELISLYFGLQDGLSIDLVTAASAAIEWAHGLKAAAHAIDPTRQYTVNFVAAEPGSSKWFAKLQAVSAVVELSLVNKQLVQVNEGFKKVPLVVRLVVGLAVVIPTTAVPTYKYWSGTEDFSPSQMKQLEDALDKARNDAEVRLHREQVYKIVQRDQNVTGLSGGAAYDTSWKPSFVVPADQFAIEDGLFQLQELSPHERVIPQTLDVILVTPRLQNAEKQWEFRQEGIPGTFKAFMKDRRFLEALDHDGIAENLRANIPMRIQLEVRQKQIDGEWQTAPRGRSVVKVLNPVA